MQREDCNTQLRAGPHLPNIRSLANVEHSSRTCSAAPDARASRSCTPIRASDSAPARAASRARCISASAAASRVVRWDWAASRRCTCSWGGGVGCDECVHWMRVCVCLHVCKCECVCFRQMEPCVLRTCVHGLSAGRSARRSCMCACQENVCALQGLRHPGCATMGRS